ncbi:MAG: putative RNA methyltransferase [Butyricicoccaceae bacterium]
MLICPHCAQPLVRGAHTLRCASGHSFDLAASGYCNLLTGSRSGDKTGDNKQMVLARRKFLDSGAYQQLRDAVCGRVLELVPQEHAQVVDAGCGEGYYTRAVAQALADSGRSLTMIGADISKSATQYAAKRDNRTTYITASAYHMPVQDHSADLILSLFAPAPSQEFARMLTAEGKVLQVVPGAEHLWELKQAVYDTPYRNREDKHTLDGFVLTDRRKLTYPAKICGTEQIEALFSMTPYAHRTPRKGLERLHALENITVTLSFVLLTFEKNEENHE